MVASVDEHRDVPDLTEGAWAQQRLLANSPVAVGPEVLADRYRAAASYG